MHYFLNTEVELSLRTLKDYVFSNGHGKQSFARIYQYSINSPRSLMG